MSIFAVVAVIIATPTLILILAVCSAASRADDALERHAASRDARRHT